VEAHRFLTLFFGECNIFLNHACLPTKAGIILITRIIRNWIIWLKKNLKV